MALTRNLEKDTLYINRWITGLVTERSPLFAPMSAMGLQIITRLDSLWDGQNTDLSTDMTLIRRPGFTRYCSSAFASDELPQGFFSFKNTQGEIKAIVDTNQRVAWFDGSGLNTIYTKSNSAQTSFTKVGDVLYCSNGVDAKRWDGTRLDPWGIQPPEEAPTLAFLPGSLDCIKGYRYVFAYKRSGTGEKSSASPTSANTLLLTNQQVELQGPCSSDPTVDKVEIYRTADGGANFYWLAEVANSGATWSYSDNSKDTELNDDLQAPLAHINDPIPTGATVSAFYLGRMWVAVDNALYFGGGPQITNGIPESCFPPANVFEVPGKITALAPTSAGLAVWTEDDLYCVLGSDLASFQIRKIQANFGVPRQNCVAQDGDLLFIFTSQGQLFTFSSALEEIGYNNRRKLGTFDPKKVSLALHRQGGDEGLFICNGVDTIYRYSVSMTCWSSAYKPAGGCGIVGAMEVDTSDYRMIMGRPTGAGYLLARDTSAWSDDGVAYSAYATIGSLIMAPPGQTVPIRSLLLETKPIGTYPTLSVLLNEISGTFVDLPSPVPDPPALPPSTSVWSKRHYFKAAQTPLPQLVRHMQVKIAFPAEAAANEVLGLAVQSE